MPKLLAADKLLQVDLSLQAIGRCGHGAHAGGLHARRGGIEDLFLLVKLLAESGYDGARVLGHVAPSAGDGPDTWEQHARTCMRTYLVLAAKARRFADDPDIQDALVDCGADSLADDTVGPFTPGASRALRAESFDATEVADQDHRRAHLDQLVTELILGLR